MLAETAFSDANNYIKIRFKVKYETKVIFQTSQNVCFDTLLTSDYVGYILTPATKMYTNVE